MNRNKTKLHRNDFGFFEYIEKPPLRDLEVFYEAMLEVGMGRQITTIIQKEY